MTVGHKKSNAPIGRRSPGRKALFSLNYPAPASWTARAGFTLIEAILALAISSIVLVTIGFVFSSALRMREHAEAELDHSIPIEHAMDLIRRDLKNVVPPGGPLEGPLESGSAEGGVDAGMGVQIYTTTGLMSPDAPWSEIQKITYSLQAPNESTNKGKDLIRTITRNLLPTSAQDEYEQFVMSGVDSLNFSYYDGTNWNDTWDGSAATNLPTAVRVSLQLAGTDADPSPKPYQILVPLMVQVETNQMNDLNQTNTETEAFGGSGTSGGGNGGMNPN